MTPAQEHRKLANEWLALREKHEEEEEVLLCQLDQLWMKLSPEERERENQLAREWNEERKAKLP